MEFVDYQNRLFYSDKFVITMSHGREFNIDVSSRTVEY